jgi:hypothetical protein
MRSMRDRNDIFSLFLSKGYPYKIVFHLNSVCLTATAYPDKLIHPDRQDG